MSNIPETPPAPPGRSAWLSLVTGPVVGLFVILVIFVALIRWREGNTGVREFLSLRNLQVVVDNVTVTGVLALGVLLIIISGGIDLSVGSVVALVTVVTMKVFTLAFEHSGSTLTASLAAIPAGILTGGLCGLTNGLIITGLRVSPFVTTLGMMGVARGLALWLAESKPLGFPRASGTPDWVRTLQQVHPPFTIFNPGFWSLVLLTLAILVLLRLLVLGRYCYAIGSNEATARLCGIGVERTRLAIYTLAGLLTGWAGVISFAHISSGDPTSSQGLELDVIAAVVIGGASLSGGQGTISGTLLGVLILGLLLSGVSFLGMPADYRYILTGGVIILSTALARLRSGEGE